MYLYTHPALQRSLCKLFVGSNPRDGSRKGTGGRGPGQVVAMTEAESIRPRQRRPGRREDDRTYAEQGPCRTSIVWRSTRGALPPFALAHTPRFRRAGPIIMLRSRRLCQLRLPSLSPLMMAIAFGLWSRRGYPAIGPESRSDSMTTPRGSLQRLCLPGACC